MRIGFFNSYALWGGGEKWHFDMIGYAKAQGEDCVLFSPAAGELFQRVKRKFEAEVESHSIEVGKYTYLNPLAQLNFVKLFKRARLDVIVFNSFIDIRAAALAAKKAGIRSVVLRAGTPIAPKEKASYIKAFQGGVDRIVGNSDEIIDVFKKDAPNIVDGISFERITNGIDISAFNKEAQSHKQQVFTFGNCCRLTEQKGLKYLVEATALLKSQTDLPFQVLIAGEGELRGELEEQIKARDLSEVIKLRGHVEDVAAFYRELDVLSFTSLFEGTARTILEAWACEVSVISFHISSMKDMLSEGEDGHFIAPFNVEAYAAKMLELLSNPQRAVKMGQQGRAKVVSTYDKSIVMRKWYQYLIQG